MQVTGPQLKSRYNHRATGFSFRPGLTEVLLFGGASSFETDDVIADTTVLTFGETTCGLSFQCYGPYQHVWHILLSPEEV